VRELPTERPDEIWIIAINPQTRRTEPRSVPEISDRRNELAGNLSLTQEVQFIEKMNRWVHEGSLARTKHQPVELRWIQMLRELDAESKLDREPCFIQGMIAYGEQQAEVFLQEREESSRTVVRRMAYA
jgi:NTE family protein